MPQRLALSPTLWLIVAPPVAGFAWQLARGLRRRDGRDGRDGVTSLSLSSSDPWAHRVGIGSVGLASAATLGHALRLARAPASTAGLIQPGAGGALAGPLDTTGFGLRFDALSGTACALACAVALAAMMLLASRPASDPRARACAWVELALAGGLLSFLADGFVAMSLGWTLAVAAAAWFEGWTDPRLGALRATRGALAVLALLVGAALRAPTADPETTPLAMVAFLVAAVAMSAPSAPLLPAGAPPVLAAVGCGGTTGLLGPFLLLRLASPVSTVSGASGASLATALAGVVMAALVGRRVLREPPGPSRWLALAGGAPAGVICFALAEDGEKGGLLVFVSAGVTAALLLLTAAMREIPMVLPSTSERTDLEAALLGRLPEDLGRLLLSFERWVVDAIAGAIAVVVYASAWALSRLDARRP